MLLASGGVQEVLGPPRPSPEASHGHIWLYGVDFDPSKPNLTVLKEEFVSPDPLRVLETPPGGSLLPPGGGIRLWESSRFSIGIPTRISRSPGGPLGKSEFFGQISTKSTEIDLNLDPISLSNAC